MENNVNEQVMDKLTKVCLCKAISRAKMKEVIFNGAKTVQEVQKATGAGSGSCCGRRCTPKIEELLQKYSSK